MEEGLKKRLVGAAVLASLAVIFIPMLVEEPADKAELIRTPPPPEAKPFESRLLREEVIRPVPKTPPTQRRPVESADQDSPPATPAQEPPTVQTGLNAWVVQVGSFSSQTNARKLVEKLRKAGFQTCDLERTDIRGRVLYRVRVGPVLEKKRALAMLPKINKLTGTKGSVRTYP